MTENKTATKHLEERLAALHQSSLELVQDISVDSLLENIARLACEQVNASCAAVGLLDDDGQIIDFVSVGLDGEKLEKMRSPSLGLGLMNLITETERAIRIDYTQKEPQHEGATPNRPRTTSLLGVPIRSGDRRLGQLYLTDKINEASFSADDEQVIETLAAYAAAAISNARSYHKLRERDHTLTRRNQDLALLNNLASALTAITELDTLLETALNRVMDYFNVTVGEIYLSEDGHHSLHKVLHQGETPQSIWKQDRFTLKESLIGQTAQSGQQVLVNLPYEADPYLQNKGLLAAGIHQIACFPLTSRSEVLGVLSIAIHQEKLLDPMDQQLLSSIASWVGTTIENVNVNLQGRRLAILEERERIGMDLHDGIIQSIYAVGLTLEHARLLLGEEPEGSRKRINQSIEDLNSTIRDLRAFIMDMRPRQLYEDNLMDGIQRLINEFRANSLVETTLSGPSHELKDLPDSQAIALFHICQEALANIAKHAQASKVEVKVWTTQDRVLMEIHDNGLGFDLGQIQFTLGHGISNMQSRARNVGGDLEITTEPGEGTTIVAWMPYMQDRDRNEAE